MSSNENYNKAIADFLTKFMKLKNLGVDEFVRQEIIFKGNALGLELHTIENKLDDVIFERDEVKKKQTLLNVLSKINQIVPNLNDIDNKSNALFLKYNCLYKLKNYEEALVAIMQAIQIYQNNQNIYSSRLRLYYEKAVELLLHFEQYDEAVFICDRSEDLCKDDKYAIVNELEEIISNKAKAFFFQGKHEKAFKEIDRAIYLFPQGDRNQYKTFRSLETRALFKRNLGDQVGYQKDKDMSEKWEEMDLNR